MLPRDISQLIFNDVVNSQRLTGVILEAFRDCALQVIHWKGIVSSMWLHIPSPLFLACGRVTEVNICCIWQDIYLGEYPGVNDSWLDVISSQGPSLLSVDLSGSEVTDSGLTHLKDCKNIQALNFNYCDHVSDRGLEHLSGRAS